MADRQDKNAPEQDRAPAQAVARNTGPAVELSFALQMDDQEPTYFTLKGTDDRITIGRKPTSDFVLTARSVSFDHCELYLQRKGRDPLLTVRDVSKNMTGVRSARASYQNDAWLELRKGEIHVLQHLSELRVPFQERGADQANPSKNLTKIKVIFVLPDAYSERDGSGRWQYIEKLGEGGLAVVYRAKDITGPLQNMGSVAVKISKFSNLDEVSPQNRHIYALHREAQWSLQRLHATSDHRYRAAGASLFARYLEDHTGFQAHSSGDFDTDRRHFEAPSLKWDQKRFCPALARRPYVVMELIKGKLLQAAMDGQPALSHQEKRSILQQCAEAFAYMEMHGVIHRDFRGCNLFLQDRGPHCKLKVIDLGFMISLEPKHLQATNSNSAVRCAWQGDPSKKLRFDWAPPEVQPKGSCNFGNPGCSFDAFSLGVLILKLLRGRQWTQEQLGKKCSGLREAVPDMEAIGIPPKLVARLLDFNDPSQRPKPQHLVAALVKHSPLALKKKQAPAVVAKAARQLDTTVAADAAEPKRNGSKLDPVASASPCSSAESSPDDDGAETCDRSSQEGNVDEKTVKQIDADEGAGNHHQIATGHHSGNDSNWTPLRSSEDEDEQCSHTKDVDADPQERAVQATSPIKEAEMLNTDRTAEVAPLKVHAEAPTDALNEIQAIGDQNKTGKEDTDSSNSSDSESSGSGSPKRSSTQAESKSMKEVVATASRSRSRVHRRSRRRRENSNGRRHGRRDRRAEAPPDYGAVQCPAWGPWQDPMAHAAAMAWRAQAHAAAAWMGNYWPAVAPTGNSQHGWMMEASRAEKQRSEKTEPPRSEKHRSEKKVSRKASTSVGSRSLVPPPPPRLQQTKIEEEEAKEPKPESPSGERSKPQTRSTAAAAAHAVARCKASTKAPAREENGEKCDSLEPPMTQARAVAFARPKASRVPPPPPPPRRDRGERDYPDLEKDDCRHSGKASYSREPERKPPEREPIRRPRRQCNSDRAEDEWSPRQSRRRRIRDDSKDSRDSRRREGRPHKVRLRARPRRD